MERQKIKQPVCGNRRIYAGPPPAPPGTVKTLCVPDRCFSFPSFSYLRYFFIYKEIYYFWREGESVLVRVKMKEIRLEYM